MKLRIARKIMLTATPERYTHCQRDRALSRCRRSRRWRARMIRTLEAAFAGGGLFFLDYKEVDDMNDRHRDAADACSYVFFQGDRDDRA